MPLPQPTYPLISIYNDKGLDLIWGPSYLSKVNFLGLLKQQPEKCVYYDGDGHKWTCLFSAAKFNNNFFTRLLANTVYNPSYPAIHHWTMAGDYTLPELQGKIKECIDADDDIITQFEEGPVIEAAVYKAANFEAVVAVLDKYIFDVDEGAL